LVSGLACFAHRNYSDLAGECGPDDARGKEKCYSKLALEQR
jgi:hypothetical protein